MKNNVMQLKKEFEHEKFELKSSHMMAKLYLLFQDPSKTHSTRDKLKSID